MKFLLATPDDIKIHANNIPQGSLSHAVHAIINYLIYIAGALAVVFVLVGAFQYVISGGNPDSTRKAKDTILYALIGVAVTASAYAIVNYVFKALG